MQPLVPLKPNELMPAIGGFPSTVGQDTNLRHPHRQLVPGDVRARIVEVQVPGNHSMFQRQHHLDQPRDSRGCLEVTDVRLHRSNQQRPSRFTSLPQHGGRRLNLDGVAQRRAGAVGLQVVDLAARCRLAAVPRGSHAPGPAHWARSSTAAAAVLVDRAAPDHSQDSVAVLLGVARAAEHHDPATPRPRSIAVLLKHRKVLQRPSGESIRPLE